MSSELGRSRSVHSKYSREARSTSPVECLLRRTRTVNLPSRETPKEEIKVPSRFPRLLESPVRLITQSSLSLSLPKLYSRSSPLTFRERSVSPPGTEARLWKSRSIRRPPRTSVTPRNVHFHVTSCTQCLSRGTIQCYCNYVPRRRADFFTLASSYPRLPEAHVSTRYTPSHSRRRTPVMSSLSQAYGTTYYDRKSTSLPRYSSVNKVGLLY